MGMKKTMNIRISEKSYKFLVQLKKKTGIPIKTIIDQIITGDIRIK